MQTASGSFHATMNRCTHYGLPLLRGTLVGSSISCPFHGACFDVRTGDIEDGPGLDPLPVFNTSVEADGFVYVHLPEGATTFPTTGKAHRCHHDAAEDSRHFVIIGAGAASMAAVDELRAQGFKGRLTVLTRDAAAHHLDRTVLSKVCPPFAMSVTCHG